MKNKKIVIAGGSGFIGQALIEYFGKENEIIILGRQSGDNTSNSYSDKLTTSKDGYNVRYVKWNPSKPAGEWMEEIDGSDLIINLAGKSVNCRYHKKQKQELISSRINPTNAIGLAIQRAINKPAVWINASSATIYQNSLDKPNDEYTGIISDWKKDNMPFNIIDNLRWRKNKLITAWKHRKNSDAYKEWDRDFSVKICKAWEAALFNQSTPGTRKIALRAAITLGKGGIMVPYLRLCKFGLGGKQGDGKQMYSWVHEEDLAAMIAWIYETKNAEGIYNCSSPNAVTNAAFMSAVRKVSGHRFGLPAPALLLEAAALLIRTETELFLKSRWAVPTKAVNEGFVFKYPDLPAALKQIVMAEN